MQGVNHAFIEIDRKMSCWYSLGYAISLFMYVLMTLLLLFVNYMYPFSYLIQFLISLTFLFMFDVIGYPILYSLV